MGLATDREISCRITRTLLLYVRESNNGSLGTLLDGLELDEQYLLDTDNWVSHAFLHQLYDRMVEILQDENAIYHMALSSDRVKSMGMLDRIARLLGSPRLIYSYSNVYNKLLKLNGDVYIHEIGDSWILLEDRYHASEQKTRYDCDYTRGVLEGIPMIFDMPPAHVEEIECQVAPERYGKRTWNDSPRLGAKGCLYKVSWDAKNKPSFWNQLLKYRIYLKALNDLREANQKIQKKYNEARGLASNLEKSNRELEMARIKQDEYLRQLEVSESRYRLLAENISDIIWTIGLEDMRFNYISPSVEKCLGFTVQEAIELSLEKTLSFQSLQEVTSAIAEELAREESKDVDLNRSRTIIVNLLCKDGSYTWGESKVTFLRDPAGRPVGIMGVTRNINERKRTEEKLRQNEEKLRLITDNMSDIVAMTDLACVFQYVSPSSGKVLGYDPREVVGTKLLDYMYPADRHDVERAIAYAFSTRQQGKEIYRFRHASGHYVWLETIVDFIFDENGRLKGGIFTSRDITERRRAEEERQSLQERLQRAEKMEALGTLAGGVAHDLNNVLGVVVGYSELLLSETSESSKIRSRVLSIMQGGERAAAIVQDLLTLARRGVHTGKVINVNDIVTDFQKSPEFLKMSSYYPRVRIETNLDNDLLNIMGSPVHLSKTLFNLVCNALESMPDKGAGQVTITTGNMYLDKPVQGYDNIKEGGYVVLSVSDTGEGIPAADMQRIFEPFYTKKVMGRSGTGLGLSVVWGTVKDHEGYVNVQSEVGKGTTVTLYFPVTRKEISPNQVSASMADYMGRGEYILVVDDIQEQRDLASEMLRKLKYNVTSVSCGEEAVEYLQTGGADIIVLDMIMDPGMDGLDTYRKILEIHPRQKAVIVSGFSETDRVSHARELGAGTYIKKPYVLEILGMAVRKELDRSIRQ
jgi:PAS domain S-box-containing protein